MCDEIKIGDYQAAQLVSLAARTAQLARAAGDSVEDGDLYARVEWSPDACQYGVWIGCGGANGSDLVGSGSSVRRAIADAAAQIAKWEAAK